MPFPVVSDSDEDEMPIGRGYNIGNKMNNMEKTAANFNTGEKMFDPEEFMK
jgi:hypothetical protein